MNSVVGVRASARGWGDWIPQLPSKWTVRRLSSLARPGYATFRDGDWIETPYITNDGIRLLQTGNIGVGQFKEQGFRYVSDATFHSLNCTEVAPGDVLICRLADPVGRACIAPDLRVRMITSVDVVILKPRDDVDPGFLVYWLSSAPYLQYLDSISRGGTRERVSRTQLGAVPTPVPPFEEQRLIADYLDRQTARIDALIERKERLIAVLSEGQPVAESMALLGTIEGPGPGKSTWPASWARIPFRRLFEEVDERSSDGSEELMSVSQTRGVIPQSELGDRRQFAETLADYKICRKGDLVINRMWVYYGALGVAPGVGLVSPDYSVFRSRGHLRADLASHLLRTPPYVGEMTRLVRGVGAAFQGAVRKPRLHPRELGQIIMPVPPIAEQERLVAELDRRRNRSDKQLHLIERSVAVLRERRHAVITAAVTGQYNFPRSA